MKKLLSIIFAAILSVSVLAIADCSDGGVPAPQSPQVIDVSANFYVTENEFSYNETKGIYYLKVGEVYKFNIIDDHKMIYNSYEHKQEYFSQLIYCAEEVEITFIEEDDYSADYSLKGLKKGSVIIQYEVKYEWDSIDDVEKTHFIDPIIQIIFE